MSKPKRRLFKDKEHLVRMAGIFAIGVVIFLGLQLLLTPKTFGLYGHYRGAAVGEEAAKPRAFAGRAVCANCHGPQVETKQAGKHATIGCESCHGPLMQHSVTPREHKPAKADVKALCAGCHELRVGRPQWVKQVKPEEHSGGAPCNDCHQPHAPQM